MNNLEIKGVTNFMGIEIPNVYGGFGEGNKAVLASTIAEIHGTRVDKVNALIIEHLDEFEEGVDILDLKVNLGEVYNFEQLGFTNMQVAKAKHIFLLSEQGYMLLVGFMKTDKAKELRKQFRREYFQMKELIQTKLDSYMIADPIERAKRWIEEEEERLRLEEQNRRLQPRADKFDEFMDVDGTFGFRELVKHINKALNKKIKETEIREFLIKEGIICKQGNKYVVSQKGVRKGYGLIRDNIVNGVNRPTTRYTDKLRDLLLNKF